MFCTFSRTFTYLVSITEHSGTHIMQIYYFCQSYLFIFLLDLLIIKKNCPNFITTASYSRDSLLSCDKSYRLLKMSSLIWYLYIILNLYNIYRTIQNKIYDIRLDLWFNIRLNS